MCRSAGKNINDYHSGNNPVEAFLGVLSSKTGMPVFDVKQGLMQIRKGSPANGGGSWIHPLVAINLGHWLSPEFAVQVSQWVYDWMSGHGAPTLPAPQALTMSSREIAKLTGKELHNVHRDIRVMLDELKKDDSKLNHPKEDKDARGYTTCFHLNRELTETLLTGYSATARLKVIRRWHELESLVALPMATTAAITKEVSRQFGGIMKSVVHKELHDAINIELPRIVGEKVQSELLKQQISVRHGVTAGSIKGPLPAKVLPIRSMPAQTTTSSSPH
jgi:phage regulator Rha-like protein